MAIGEFSNPTFHAHGAAAGKHLSTRAMREAAFSQYCPFLPVNTAALLTGIPERISKSGTSGCRGRDTDHSVPPAQNRTSASTHTASALDVWRQSVPWDKDARHEESESIGRGAAWAAPNSHSRADCDGSTPSATIGEADAGRSLTEVCYPERRGSGNNRKRPSVAIHQRRPSARADDGSALT